MPLRRSRFGPLVERQLELFAQEHVGLVRDTEAALRAYTGAASDEAEERYGDYLDLVETGQEELAELRDAYARTLDEETAAEYRAAFNRMVRKRLPRYALDLE
ncbi:MAG: hypothetical protein ICV74_05015 [Thermoleophilia bacterium]|nr:hypothetical protein [Thermoleophilia bacterium]